MPTNITRDRLDQPDSDLPYALDDPDDDLEHDHGNEALATLHRRTVDALKGYDKMVEKAQPEFRSTVERFRSLHTEHASRLARILAVEGHNVNDGASLMGTINQAVVSVRAFVDDIDEDVMAQIRTGESWILAAFDDAINARRDGLGAGLHEMRSEIDKLIADTAHVG